MSHDATRGPLVEHFESAPPSAPASDVARVLLAHCPPEGLITLLTCRPNDIVRAAIVALGLKGSMEHCPALAQLVRLGHGEVAELAEESLWRIWLRAGSNEGNAELAHAVGLIDAGRFQQAVTVLTRLTGAEPTFAEAHHQRGIALSLLGRPEEAAEAFELALRYNPYHFTAAVSLGHAYAQRGQFRAALRHYRRALELNPRLEAIPEAVERIEAMVGENRVSP